MVSKCISLKVSSMGRTEAEVQLYADNKSTLNVVCVMPFWNSQWDKGAVEPFMGHLVYSRAAMSSTKDPCDVSPVGTRR